MHNSIRPTASSVTRATAQWLTLMRLNGLVRRRFTVARLRRYQHRNVHSWSWSSAPGGTESCTSEAAWTCKKAHPGEDSLADPHEVMHYPERRVIPRFWHRPGSIELCGKGLMDRRSLLKAIGSVVH